MSKETAAIISKKYKKRNLSNIPDRTAEIAREHRALAILRLLDRDVGYRSNDHVISACLSGIGLSCGQENLVELVGFLKRENLIRTNENPGLEFSRKTAPFPHIRIPSINGRNTP